ncbi:MAG: hypothetical protein ACRD6X_07830 [Pyrinomonadaceae bacterium]
MPTIQEFRRAVFNEPEDLRNPESTDRSIVGRLLAAVWLSTERGLSILPTRSAAVAGLLILATVGFSLLILVPQFTPTNNEVAAAGDGAETYSSNAVALSSDEPDRRTGSGTEEENRIKERHSNRPPENIDRMSSRGRDRKLLGSSERSPSKRVLADSQTRGSIKPCSESASVVVELGGTETGVRLSWQKVAGALAYTAYLSDLDERLIDQFETGEAMSRSITSNLGPDTTYKWTLIVDLKNGKRIQVTTRNFKPSELIKSSDKIRAVPLRNRSVASIVRCTEDK